MAFLFAKPGPMAGPSATSQVLAYHGHRAAYYGMLKRGAAAHVAHDIESIVAIHCATYGVPRAVVLAIIEVESDFKPAAISPGGDLGLMQVRLATARKCMSGTSKARAMNPGTNIHIGVWYLKQLHDDMVFQDLESPDEFHASIIAYNAGPAAARRAMYGTGTVGLKYYAKIRKAIARWQRELA